MTHNELSALAVKWLKRPNSQGGHGCLIACAELRSGWNGEIPDAIGFRLSGNTPQSVVVEAKTSRSDFLADKAKPHRIADGMGNYRYFICPENLIKPDELPDGWGLLWVNARGHIKAMAGVAITFRGDYRKTIDALNTFRFEPSKDREMWLLVRLLSRVGDPEQVNAWIKESNRLKNKYMQIAEKQEKDIRELRSQIFKLKYGEAA